MTEGRSSVGTPDAAPEDAETATNGHGVNGHHDTAEAHGSSSTDEHGTVPAATLPGEDSAGDAAAQAPADDAVGGTPTGAASDGDAPTTDTTGDSTDTGKATTATSHAAADDSDEWADAEDKAYKRELRKGLAFGLAGGVVVGAIVALLLGAFVYPGYLMGPGSPDDAANRITAALSTKDAPALDGLSCRGPDGASVAQLSPQVLQLIGKVTPTGPTTTVIDTEARTPVDIELSFQGQSQTLPSEVVLGQSKGDWCLKGLAQRQQQ